jgi:O-acetyl-ADP-ribose deacetylase (regulator of RNase III)
MIVYKKGDLLKSGAEIIVHGCNCFHVMGAGVAQMIKHKWPRALMADKAHGPEGDRNRLGCLSLSHGDTPPTPEYPLIVNMYTQYSYTTERRQLDYEALYLCMESLAGLVQSDVSNPKWRVAMPKIGAGLAGGDWDIIEMIVNRTFGDREVEVWLYDPAAN